METKFFIKGVEVKQYEKLVRQAELFAEMEKALRELCWFGSSADEAGFCTYCQSSEKYHAEEADCPVIIGRTVLTAIDKERNND